MSKEQKTKRKRQYLFQMFEQQWTCPISSIPIIQPVVTSDGHTYEKLQITKWLQKQNTSPKTGLILQTMEILPNIALKNVINKFDKQIKYEIEKIVCENKQSLQKVQGLQQKVKQLENQLQSEKEKNSQLQKIIDQYKKQKQTREKNLQKQLEKLTNSTMKIKYNQQDEKQLSSQPNPSSLSEDSEDQQNQKQQNSRQYNSYSISVSDSDSDQKSQLIQLQDNKNNNKNKNDQDEKSQMKRKIVLRKNQWLGQQKQKQIEKQQIEQKQLIQLERCKCKCKFKQCLKQNQQKQEYQEQEQQEQEQQEQNQQKQQLKIQRNNNHNNKHNRLLPSQYYLLNHPVLYNQKIHSLDHSNIKINLKQFFKYDWSHLQLLKLRNLSFIFQIDNVQINDKKFEQLAQGLSRGFEKLKILKVTLNNIFHVRRQTMQKLSWLNKIKFFNNVCGNSIKGNLSSSTKMMLRKFSQKYPKINLIY